MATPTSVISDLLSLLQINLQNRFIMFTEGQQIFMIEMTAVEWRGSIV